MMVKQLVSLLSAVMVLGACASMTTQFRKMAEPADGARARVRIAANMQVFGTPESSCIDNGKAGSGTIHGGILGSSGYRGRSLGMPDPQNTAGKHSSEFYARAGKPLTVVLVNTPESPMLCSIAVSLVPREGHDYELLLKTERSGAMKSLCSAIAYDITGGMVREVPVQMAKQCR